MSKADGRVTKKHGSKRKGGRADHPYHFVMSPLDVALADARTQRHFPSAR